MSVISLINSLPGAVAQGLIWGIMAIGVYLTFRILDFADLTVDGSLCTGGAVCIMMMLSGTECMGGPCRCNALAGMAAGFCNWHTPYLYGDTGHSFRYPDPTWACIPSI